MGPAPLACSLRCGLPGEPETWPRLRALGIVYSPLSILLAPTLLIRFLFALSACPSPLGAWPLGWPHPVLRVGLRQPPYPRPRGGPSSHITLTSPKSPYAYLAAGPCRGRPPQKIKQVTCRGQCQNRTEV